MARIDRTGGTEGPRHDPYGWEEWTVEKNGLTFTLHQGLVEWVELRDSRGETRFTTQPVLLFETWVGCSLKSLEKAWNRLQYTCKKCGGTSTHSVDGYPGETVNLCDCCGSIVSADFHPSAVM